MKPGLDPMVDAILRARAMMFLKAGMLNAARDIMRDQLRMEDLCIKHNVVLDYDSFCRARFDAGL